MAATIAGPGTRVGSNRFLHDLSERVVLGRSCAGLEEGEQIGRQRHPAPGTIDFPDAASTRPTAINPQGDIVGYYRDLAGRDHGFLIRR